MTQSPELPEPEPRQGDDPLGAALGDAIGHEVDDTYVPPPVTDIAARAEARAKARATRRTVGSVAASIALVAGGIVGYAQLRDDDPQEIATAPTETEVADDASTSGLAESEALSDPAASEVVEAPEEGSSADFEVPTTAELSTGPTLTWTEIEPPFQGGGFIEATSDGRLLARSYAGSTVGLYLSADGQAWEQISVPNDWVDQVDVSGDTYAVVGWNGDEPGDTSVVYLSTDAGASWTELDPGNAIVEEAAAARWMVRRSYVSDVMVGNGDVVIIMGSFIDYDFTALLESRGLVEDGQDVWGYGWGNGVITIEIGPSHEDFSESDEEPQFPEPVEFTYEELGLSEAEIAALEEGGGGGEDLSVVLLSDDGGPFEEVSRFNGSPGQGTKAGDGYVISLYGRNGPQVIASADGRSWQSVSGPETGDVIGAPDGSLWSLSWEPGFTLQRASGLGADFEVVAQFPALNPEGMLSVGESGVVATVRPGSPAREVAISEEGLPTGSVTKDGYELRYNDPVGGISLYDLETGEAVYVFDEEDANSEEPPEGVIEEDGDGPDDFRLTFLDPDSGEPLVSFTAEDFAELWGVDPEALNQTSELSEVPDDAFTAPDVWVGWSADGTAWGWQTLQEAFGIDADDAWASLAVGDGIVVASVEVYETIPFEEEAGFSETGEGTVFEGEAGVADAGSESVAVETNPPRWFIAEVPG